ncbi:hypothetical protein Rsub_06246 [Raphidocelis subcapitata]|uniref:Uncharacterized protein n=1 Tax=Raphidocelis subcapitata TaxID=307507 RepID=A0A2V0PA04_9CHLO|nr:hypothetical protein Rsub_06246 [Raphidocelis subcapitata]|eukprot:GBF93997.1 hypothetical protein Rsub_06246 [Raphidocelis subcapitata]
MALEGDREAYFCAAIAQAQREHAADSSSTSALLRWGNALLELAHYRRGDEALQTIHEAIARLQDALELDPTLTEAHFTIGNALLSLGFLQQTRGGAAQQFDRASLVFAGCVDKDPENDSFLRALEMSRRAVEYWEEIKQHQEQATQLGARAGGGGDPLGLPDFVWDALGWGLLAAAIGGIVLLARSGGAAPPHARS